MDRMIEKTMETASRDWPDRLFRGIDQAFCLLCGRYVRLLTFAQAADFFKTGRPRQKKPAKKTGLHLIHNRQGQAMICSHSLAKYLNYRQREAGDSQIISLKPLI